MRRVLPGFLAVLLALLPVGTPAGAARASAQGEFPISGEAVEALAAYDDAMLQLMAKWELPGGALAVVRNGRLVLARGYGLADREAGQPVQPDALFRIASLSKPITAVAILQLVEQGRLDLDAKAFRLLQDLRPADATVDPRLWEITVRQLLSHTAGWDRTEGNDLMFRPRIAEATRALGAPEPGTCETGIRYTFTQPLDFDPGTRYGYSNLGYCVLGRILERVSVTPYVEYVTANVLGPVGAGRMRIGGSTSAERAEGEVRYYDYPGAPLVTADAPGMPGRVPYPDGGMYFGRFDAWGGWVASPIEYARFLSAVAGQRGPALLQPATMALATSRPPAPVWEGSPTFYGLGWTVRPHETGLNFGHQGSLPGSRSVAMVRSGGTTFVAMFNSRPPRERNEDLGVDLERTLTAATIVVKSWPEHDLFDQFP